MKKEKKQAKELGDKALKSVSGGMLGDPGPSKGCENPRDEFDTTDSDSGSQDDEAAH